MNPRLHKPVASRTIASLCLALVVSSAPLSQSCGATESRLEPRFVSIHNTLSAMGMAQTGPINEGSLPEGADARVVMRLDGGGCYTFVALGTTQVRDLDLRVLDETGEEIGRDATSDRQAAAQACPETSGEYQIVVHMASGQGGYTMSGWSGGSRGAVVVTGGQSPATGGGRGSCGDPLPLEVGRPVHGDTQQGASHLEGSCANGAAPEQVYRMTLDQRGQVSIVLQSSFDGAVYLLRTCGQNGGEIGCNDDAPDTSRSEISATLDAGTYFVVVDGYGNESGEYDLIVSVAELQAVGAVCRAAPLLTAGQQVSGTTTGMANYFQATCAGGAQSPDRVYRLEVPQRSRLRVRQQSDHDGALYLRRSCQDPTTELACNDDFRDQRNSLVTAIVDPGSYFVFSDGFSSGNAGNFTVTAELTGDGGGNATGDACGAAAALTLGQQTDVDTFDARDDLSGSCGGQGGGDVVYAVDVRSRSRLRATFAESEFAGTLYLQRTCGDATTELGCSAFAEAGEGDLDRIVEPGHYFLVVDGQRPESFGRGKLEVHLDDLVALERDCRQAPLLRPGQTLNGNTTNSANRFRASCAGGAMSNDLVYRLRLTRRSVVRLNMSSDYDGVLHMRRDCVDSSSEIACNDDHNDNQHSFIEQTLDAGTYFVIVDGFREGNQGPFTLDVAVSQP